MVASTLISRDPFAREELHRIRLYGTAGCTECGQQRKTPKGRAFLFVYETQTDGGRNHTHKGKFCCLPCHDSYHGGRS